MQYRCNSNQLIPIEIARFASDPSAEQVRRRPRSHSITAIRLLYWSRRCDCAVPRPLTCVDQLPLPVTYIVASDSHSFSVMICWRRGVKRSPSFRGCASLPRVCAGRPLTQSNCIRIRALPASLDDIGFLAPGNAGGRHCPADGRSDTPAVRLCRKFRRIDGRERRHTSEILPWKVRSSDRAVSIYSRGETPDTSQTFKIQTYMKNIHIW